MPRFFSSLLVTAPAAQLVLRDVSCPTQASCVAAGSFYNNHGDPQGVVESHT